MQRRKQRPSGGGGEEAGSPREWGSASIPLHPTSADSLRVCSSVALHTHAVYGERIAGAPLSSAPFTPDKTPFA